MVRKYGHGWFREPVRHGLAARGIKTNKYFARSRKQIVRELFREGRVAEAERLQKEIEMRPGVAQSLPDPESSRSQFVKRVLSKEGVESVMEELRHLNLPAEEKALLMKKAVELKKIQDFLESDELREERKQLKDAIRDLKEDIRDEPDEVRVIELEEELDTLEDRLEPIDTKGLAKRRDELLDEVNELRGFGTRKSIVPGFFTEDQLRSRLGVELAKDLPDVDELPKAALVKAFRQTFKREFPEAEIVVDGERVVVKASRPEVVEKLPEGMKLTTDKELSEDEMKDFLRRAVLRRKVASEKPFLRSPLAAVAGSKEEQFRKEPIVVEGRSEPEGLLFQLGKLQERGQKLAPQTTEMETAPDLSKISARRLSKKPVKVSKDVVLPRQDVSSILEKRAEKRAEAAEMRAKEVVVGPRAQASAPGRVLVEEAKEARREAKKKRKDWKDVGIDFGPEEFQ